MDIQHPKLLSNHINKENLELQFRTVSPFKLLYSMNLCYSLLDKGI